MATASNSDSNKPVKIALNLIKADRRLQPREEMDKEHQERMARSYVEGEDIPPAAHVFLIAGIYWLVDGFHRFGALWSLRYERDERNRERFTHILAFVHHGTMEEAIEFAVKANLDNRSKPLSDIDRRKAMFMLMDIEEWRVRSAASIGKAVGLSNSTAKRYWLEYFANKGVPAPENIILENGSVRPTTRRTIKNGNFPKITNHGGYYSICLNGNQYSLGSDPDRARAEAERLIRNIRDELRGYDPKSDFIQSRFTRANFSCSPIFCIGGKYPGMRGLKVRGIAVVWESFRDSAVGGPRALGLAEGARAKIGSARVVCLCPEFGRPSGTIELGTKLGIEFMTIEEFIASLKAAGTDVPDGDTSPTEEPTP